MKLRPPVNTGPLLKIALPCFLEQLLAVVVGIVSTMIVGQLGKSELTASTMSNTVITWIQCVLLGLATGSTIVIARMHGDGDTEGVKTAFAKSIQLNLMLSIPMTVLLILFQVPIMKLFFGGADAEVMANMRIYFGICLVSLPATAVYNSICASLRGVGDNKTALLCTALLNVVNLVMSYALIYGFEPMSIAAMGIKGAAIALTCARYITMLVIVIYVLIAKRDILPGRQKGKSGLSVMKRITNVGIPSAAEQLLFQGGFVVLQSLLVVFGTTFQAGYQIGSNLNGIICVPSTALGTAVTALTSQALGKRDHKEALGNVSAVQFLYVIIFSLMGLVMFVFSEELVRLYTNDKDVIRSGVYFIKLFTVESFAVGYFQSMQGVLKGAGDIKYILVTSCVALWLCRIVGTWVLSRHISPYIAIAIGLSLDFYLRAIMYHFRVKRGHWLYIRI